MEALSWRRARANLRAREALPSSDPPQPCAPGTPEALRRRGGPPQALNIHLGAMNSLRDVDDAAEITAATKEEARALRRFIKG